MAEAVVGARGRALRRVRLPRGARPATAVLGVLMVGTAVLLLYAGRHLSFYFDEWTFALLRRGGGIGTYLDPHNGHLVLFPVLVYKLLFALVGLRHYLPYRAVAIVLHLACGALLYVIVRRRLGEWLALVPATLLLLLGSGYEEVLWPFQIAFLSSIAGGLAAIALLERRDSVGDAWAAAALCFSASGSGVGIPFLIACGVMIILQGSSWRRLWVVAAPAVLLGIWYLGWGSGESITSDGVLAAPQFVADAFSGTVSGIAGLGPEFGPALAVGTVALIAIAWRKRHGEKPSPLLFAALAGALTFWVLSAIVRVGSATPAAPRYIYVGAVFILLIAAEAGIGTSVRGMWTVLAGVALAGMLVGNVSDLRNGERALRRAESTVRASLTGLEIAAPVESPTFVPQPVYAPQISAGPYLAMIRDLGSPALTVSELQRAPESIRTDTDIVLQRAEQVGPAPGPRPSGCQPLITATPGAVINVDVPPPARLVIHPGGRPFSAVYLRRFASDFISSPSAVVSGSATQAIHFPADRAPTVPWHVRVAGARSAEVCAG